MKINSINIYKVKSLFFVVVFLGYAFAKAQELKDLVVSLAIQQAKTDAQMAKTDAQMERTDKRINE